MLVALLAAEYWKQVLWREWNTSNDMDVCAEDGRTE
jgi:hypothetical protein